MKFVVTIIMLSMMIGCVDSSRIAHLEQRVGNLELEDERTNKDIEIIISNEVENTRNIEELTCKIDHIVRKK